MAPSYGNKRNGTSTRTVGIIKVENTLKTHALVFILYLFAVFLQQFSPFRASITKNKNGFIFTSKIRYVLILIIDTT